MKEKYVCIGGMRNGKAYHRALDIAQTIMQEYPNQSVCIISLDDYKKALADERENNIEEVDMHLREAGYIYDPNMGIGDNIGSALLKEYADGYKKGEQDGRADERAKLIEEVNERYNGDLGSFGFWLYEQMKEQKK